MDQPTTPFSLTTEQFPRFVLVYKRMEIAKWDEISSRCEEIANEIRQLLIICELVFDFQDKVCYEVKNLELGCQYFLQVQAVAIYGGRRLASRKASKVFNSTDYEKYGKD